MEYNKITMNAHAHQFFYLFLKSDMMLTIILSHIHYIIIKLHFTFPNICVRNDFVPEPRT